MTGGRSKATGLAVMGVLVMGLGATATAVMAQGYGASPKLVRPAQFGEVREILGSAHLVAQPVLTCPEGYRPLSDGPCLQTTEVWMKKTGQTRARIVAAAYQVAAGDHVAQGNGYGLYEVTLGNGPVSGGGRLSVEALPYTSDVFVPRGCYRLNGQDVVYRIEARPEGLVAQESQTVICGGGPDQPRGPYVPVGPTIPSAPPPVGLIPAAGDSYRRTEIIRTQGVWRYLAMPEAGCESGYIVRNVYCARSGVLRLQANPAEKELDLIAAVRPVAEGQALGDKDMEQLVLKRQSKGFKADKRWFKKSMLTLPADCSPASEDGFFVRRDGGQLFAVEEVNARCGAPLAPVPADIYETYSDVAVPVVMSQRDCPSAARLSGDYCFRDAIDYMKAYGRNAQLVLMANRRVYDGDHLFDGGPYGTGFQRGTLRRKDDGSYKLENSYSTSDSLYLSGCQTYDGPEPEREGYVVYRYRQQVMAVAYRWVACPVY